MPYNNNIPQANQPQDESQPLILQNFQNIDTIIGVNHQTFGQPGEGKHKFLQMPEQGAPPATLANEGGLYTAQGAYSTVTELLFRRENNGASIPLTEALLAASPGWTLLPSGLLVKWGNFDFAPAGGSQKTGNWAVGPTIRPFVTCYQVWAFPRTFNNAPTTGNGYTVSVRSFTNLSITFDAIVGSVVDFGTPTLVWNAWTGEVDLSVIAIGI